MNTALNILVPLFRFLFRVLSTGIMLAALAGYIYSPHDTDTMGRVAFYGGTVLTIAVLGMLGVRWAFSGQRPYFNLTTLIVQGYTLPGVFLTPQEYHVPLLWAAGAMYASMFAWKVCDSIRDYREDNLTDEEAEAAAEDILPSANLRAHATMKESQ